MKTDLVLALEYKKPKLILKIFLLFILALVLGVVVAFTFLTIKTNRFIKISSQTKSIRNR
jgi:uncharacterized protein involved in exopolysaccharide biosynthesis